MIVADDVIKYYQYFYSKRYANKKYKFVPSEKSLKLISTFLNLISKKHLLVTLGDQFLWNYFVFQFKYWSELDIKSFSEKIQPSYIIGKKAVERWFLRDIEYDYLFQRCDFIETYGLSKNDVIQQEKHAYKGDHEINIKTKFHNTPNGFDLCLTMTTLYNHKHICCMSCNYRSDCKAILKENFPNIYAKRGYNNTKQN